MKNLLKTNRLNRRSFITNLLLGVILIMLLPVIIASVTGTTDESSSGALYWVGAVALGVGLIASWTFIMVCCVLRLHDLGARGWWSIGVLVPYASFVLWVVLLFFPGKKSKKWGKRVDHFQFVGFEPAEHSHEASE